MLGSSIQNASAVAGTNVQAALAAIGISLIDETLADDASIDLTDASNGICFININGESTFFSWAADGTIVEMGGGTANIDYADTDGMLAVFATGTQVSIRNRLGGSYAAKGFLVYLP